MKKIILIIFLITSFAQAKDYTQYCSINPPSRGLGGFLMSTSGLNTISRNIIENQIEQTIKRETGSKFKIKINNFYSSNIFNGEFKSIKANSQKYAHEGFYLTDIKIQTICPYNHISFEENKLYFKENMVLNYSAMLTPDDLKNTINSQKIDYRISSILEKISKYGSVLPLITKFKPLSLSIKIDENNRGKLKIDNIKVEKNNIILNGHIIIKKNRA